MLASAATAVKCQSVGGIKEPGPVEAAYEPPVGAEDVHEGRGLVPLATALKIYRIELPLVPAAPVPPVPPVF